MRELAHVWVDFLKLPFKSPEHYNCSYAFIITKTQRLEWNAIQGHHGGPPETKSAQFKVYIYVQIHHVLSFSLEVTFDQSLKKKKKLQINPFIIQFHILNDQHFVLQQSHVSSPCTVAVLTATVRIFQYLTPSQRKLHFCSTSKQDIIDRIQHPSKITPKKPTRAD